MNCKQCGKEVNENITEQEFDAHDNLCPFCFIKNNMECIDEEPIYDENNILLVSEGRICCYGCINYDVSDGCYLKGKLQSPVKIKCSEYNSILLFD